MGPSKAQGVARRVVLADRHPVVREGLRSVLNQRLSAPVIFEANTVPEALAVLETARADLLISGVEIEGGGIELARQVRSRWPAVCVLLFSSLSDTVHAERALAAGAMGYLAKDKPLAEVADAVEAVLAGRVYVGPRVRQQFVRNLVSAREHRSPLDLLTDRELSVFEHFGRGLTRSEIAAALSLSAKTVDSHRARIQQKLGLKSVEMLHRAAAQALSDPVALTRTPGRPFSTATTQSGADSLHYTLDRRQSDGSKP